MHILDHGRSVVAISRLGAGGTGVVAVETKSMGPTKYMLIPSLMTTATSVSGAGGTRTARGTSEEVAMVVGLVTLLMVALAL